MNGKRLDFLSNKLNKYSIRKFTVGTASILVGATLLFGLSNQAEAQENSTNTTELDQENTEAETNQGKETLDNTEASPSKEVAENAEEPTSNEVPESIEEVAFKETPQGTEEATSKEDSEVTEEPTSKETPQNVKESTSEEASEPTEEVASKETSRSTEEAAPKEVSERIEESTSKETPQNTSQSTETLPKENNVDISHVTDKETTITYYKNAANVSNEKAREVVRDLDTKNMSERELQLALLKDLANKQKESKPLATVYRSATPRDSESINIASNRHVNTLATTSNQIVDVDAIASGKITKGSDFQTTKGIVSGWLDVATDNYSPGINGSKTALNDYKVYLQWMDKDGTVSPVYQAITHDLGGTRSDQGGNGTYAFDIGEGWTDANGKVHKPDFQSVSGQKYKMWLAPGQNSKNGNEYFTYRKQPGNSTGFSGAVVPTGEFILAGHSIQRTAVYVYEKPTNATMTTPESEWKYDDKGPDKNPSYLPDTINKKDRYAVSGKVWWETSTAGTEYPTSAGESFVDQTLEEAKNGFRVVTSVLTPEGKQALSTTNGIDDVNERIKAQQALIKTNPEYIQQTVVAPIVNGEYTARFDDKFDVNYMYQYVMDKDGNVVPGYTGYSSPVFTSPNDYASSVPFVSANKSYAYNVHFALVADPAKYDIDITNFDAIDNVAHPGDTAVSNVSSMYYPGEKTEIVWLDTSGDTPVELSRTAVNNKAEAESAAQFTVPEDIDSRKTYTVQLVVNDNVIAADTFAADNVIKLEIDAIDNQTVVEGNPIADVTVNTNKPGSEIKVEGLPEGVTYHPETGIISGTPIVNDWNDNWDPNNPSASTFEEERDFQVTVTVTDENGATASEDFVIKVQRDTDKDGMPDIVDDDDDGDGVPDDNEINGSTNPKDSTDHLGDKDHYEPTTEGVTKDHGTPTTAEDVTGAVTIPDYPNDKEQPKITVDDESQLPNGNTPGTTEVDVTVTYPDGTTDHIKVPVTVGNEADNQAYEPTTEGVTKDHGTPATAEDVTGAVTIPDYPNDKEQPKITVDDESQLPDGNTPGTTEVDVTVTYPDGTTDHIKVPVTVGNEADNRAYEPTTEGVTKDHGTPATAEDVTGAVTIPDYPSDKEQPKITVDDESQLPDGNTPGTTEVDVTVTYPDGTTDHIKVPVTVGNEADNQAYEPTTEGVTKDHGTPTTAEDVTGAVTIPDYPSDKEQPKITVDDESQLPNGNTPGTTEVDVTVTYPDGTKDHIKVPVTVGNEADNQAYEPTTEGVTKDHGTPTTAEDVTGAVTIPDYPSDKEQPKITVDDESQLPDGNTPGTTEVDVTVTYPDGTTDHIKVPVTVGNETQANTNNPGYDDISVKPGETSKVPQNGDNTMPDGTKYKVDETKIPSGWEISVDQNTGELTVKPSKDAVPGTSVVIPVTVMYPDGSTEEISAMVTVGDVVDIPAPTVNPVDDNDKVVTGSNGTPGNTIVVTFPDGSTSEGKVDKDGNWTVDIPKGVDLDKGDIITAVEKDEKGNISTPTNVVVGENCDNSSDGNNAGDGKDDTSSDGNNAGDGEADNSSDGNNAGDGKDDTSSDSNNAGNGKDDNSSDGNNAVGRADNNASDSSIVGDEEGNNLSDGSHSIEGNQALPETGETESKHATIFGTLFAGLGLLLFRRRNKREEQ
ncbi:Rib/alpha-like domain-containing protein [Staphylococcus edaphicus]|uniref:YPDG domain-containing protein n=1 Tax=Staphylococcus edaphicus TaxID=1955013 RepID=A0A2C6U8I9_9STAP|nr:Rib/alpha-like domain-containing protein [Staphylococcus edaphicus]PHK50122.1 hypothetical protein BTJ66_05065 [Staphylococcus edaphicus]UQW81620.1 YPDG domain-containing protein [Staphylococcus edaphicus]